MAHELSNRNQNMEFELRGLSPPAVDARLDEIEAYGEHLRADDIDGTRVVGRDDSTRHPNPEINDAPCVRSIDFFDPDGLSLDFANPSRAFTSDDARHAPAPSQTGNAAVDS